MKIISLLPAATEIVFLLGLENNLVAISDDSDYPPQVSKIPKITQSLIPQTLSSRDIDKKVKESKHTGIGVFHLDQKMLANIKPDLILTQELCEVCAISFTEVEKAARILDSDTKILSLEPESLSDIFENLRIVGKYTEREKVADQVIGGLRKRLVAISDGIASPDQVEGRLSTPRNDNVAKVLIIEWLDPIMIAGHWVPEMVEIAGGKMMFAKPGERSREISWNQVLEVNPDVIIIAPCGFTIKRTKQELHLITERKGFQNLKAVKNKKVFLMDGNAYLTRPGARIVDGIEIFAEIFHSQFKRNYKREAWQLV